jgi:NADH-quinone oxidoreductase subunit F
VTFEKIQAQAVSEWKSLQSSQKPLLLAGAGTCGVAAGAVNVLQTLEDEMARQKVEAIIMRVGCMGLCFAEPMIGIVKPGRPQIIYGNLNPENAAQLVKDYLVGDNPRADLAMGYVGDSAVDSIPYLYDLPVLKPQVRLVLHNCGFINPENINHYIANGGYSGLVKALTMSPEAIIEEIKKSGLRGRGGAGFPTGQKWDFCRKAPGNEKYIICNADEGDPGAFMNRSLLEGDPHSVLEGMAIGAYTMGANHGYIYCRAEYPLALERLRLALRQMEEYGFIGNNILGSGFDFHIKIKEGAGAFVCGEETALMASIEGKRGTPRARPPFPAISGLWGKPTNINNVETWANAALILQKGSEWYAGYGAEKSKGTKTFALVGKVVRTGLIEVPFGITLGQIIYDIGGGILKGKVFKAVQTGGPSGGCLTSSMLDSSVDYESLAAAGSIIGSGGMIVADEDTCMVDLTRYFLAFTQAESCGKCTPCRVGTRQMLGILTRITQGEGKPEDIEQLEKIASTVKQGSLCGLGQTAPNPVLTTLRYFRNEYEEHIKRHHCRAATCKGIVKAPCSHTCPAGIDVPRYVRFAQQGKFSEACAVIREKVPFPGILGRVCFHPCELKCRRGELDEAIAIKALKRIAADQDTGLWRQNAKIAPGTGKRVAIVGSGPAGLTAAYYLAKLGHSVTVFEALPKAGGMMQVGIPEYRLPRRVLDAEIDEIRNMGVNIKTNSKIESLTALLDQGFNAIFLAVGAHKGSKMGVVGEDKVKVIECVDFLRKVNLGEKVQIGKHVAVIGGGNAAIDGARTALRLGAKEVTIIYRRTQTEMPASPEEVNEALKEGVNIVFLAAPNQIARNNGKLSVECIRMALGKYDASGRRRPEPISGSEFKLSFDTVIAAIGQTTDIPPQFGLETNRGILPVDSETLATNVKGVFAGGDCITGPASVIEAIAAGRQGAISIDNYLGGEGNIDEELAPKEEAVLLTIDGGEKYRPSIYSLPLSERLSDFGEVELAFDLSSAKEESKRCLRCDLEAR